jgi:hypothetical protein
MVNFKKGTIISKRENISMADMGIDFPQKSWSSKYNYSLHFAKITHFYILLDVPSNNGNVLIKGSDGRLSHLNVCIDDFEVVRE